MGSEALRARGWVRLGRVVEDDVVDALRRAFDAMVDEDVARARYRDRDACLAVCQRWPQVWVRHAAFRAVLGGEAGLAALGAGLLGLPSVRLLFMDVVVKVPRSRLHVPWHQDLPQWPIDGAPAAAEPPGVLTWVALDPVDHETGGLRYLAGGHRQVSPPEADIDDAGPMAAGDALAHDARAWHATGPNRSDRPRRALLAAFADPRTPRQDAHPWHPATNPVFPSAM